MAILTKLKVQKVTYGIGHSDYDHEGRLIEVMVDNLCLVNVYLPSGSMGYHRQLIKYEWLDLLYNYLQELKYEGKNVIVCGDFNICHQAIDIHNPKANENTSGFLPKERAWMTKLFSKGYIDTFRFLNLDNQAYTWWTYRAGAKQRIWAGE